MTVPRNSRDTTTRKKGGSRPALRCPECGQFVYRSRYLGDPEQCPQHRDAVLIPWTQAMAAAWTLACRAALDGRDMERYAEEALPGEYATFSTQYQSAKTDRGDLALACALVLKWKPTEADPDLRPVTDPRSALKL